MEKTYLKISVANTWEKTTLFFLIFVSLFFVFRYAFWWFNISHIPFNWNNSFHFLDIFIFFILSFIVFIGLMQRFSNWFALIFMKIPKFRSPQKNLRVAFLTCFVPGKEPIDLLEKTLTAMVSVRYVHDTWVLDEGNDKDVKRLCNRLGVKHFSRAGVEKYNQAEGYFRTKTKAGNHNSWRDLHEDDYDIVAQIDMDHVPKPEYLERTLGYFKDSKVALVAMPQIYKNLDNWIAKGSAEQAYFFHGQIQKGYYGVDMPLLIGTSHLYRSKAMKKIGGYAPTIVEDHLTGMLFYANGYKGVFVPEVLAEGEGPVNWVDYFNQQMRWSFGLFEILFKHTPGLLFKLSWKRKINYFLAQLYYFTGVGVFLGIILISSYLIFGIRSANMDIFEWLTYSFPPFFMANLIQIYAHRFSIDPKNEPRLGILGMMLNIGANIIYAVAFFKFITGQKLKYMVTQKGKNAKAQIVPLRTFTLHLILVVILSFALVVSFLNDNSAFQIRSWAVFNILTLFIISISIYWQKIKLILQSTIFKYSLSFCFLILLFFGLVNKSVVAESIFEVFPKTDSYGIEAEPISNKVKTPPDGVYFGLSMYTHNDQNSINQYEELLSKEFSLIGYYSSWGSSKNEFDKEFANFISKKGAIPFITWEPWIPIDANKRTVKELKWQSKVLESINSGDYDSYIRKYAKDVKEFKKPVMIRFAHEMNGDWYPWASAYNSPKDYILAWRRVHNIFTEEGVTNVSWVWSPNEIFKDKKVPYPGNIDVFYPGDEFVDWVGFSAFNWAGFYKQNVWKDPEKLYTPTINALKKYNKPIIITETSSAESLKKPKAKAEWLAKFFEYIVDHPEIKGVVWFNTEDYGIDWKFNSSSETEKAFKRIISSEYFISGVN